MAKKHAKGCGCGCSGCKCSGTQEYFSYGILVTLFGCLWLADELGWFHSVVPMGPLIAIIIGLSLLLPWLKE